eukprot:jgi/Ulvmu1/2222/UM013_0069.1
MSSPSSSSGNPEASPSTVLRYMISHKDSRNQRAPRDVVASINATSAGASCAQRSREWWERLLTGVRTNLPSEHYEKVCDLLIDAWRASPAVEKSLQFELKLGHSCSAGACSCATCELCINSASRPCPQLLKAKYLLGDALVPACGAAASVRLIRTDAPNDDVSPDDMRSLPPFLLQVCALPWDYFKDRRDKLPWDTIHDCKTILEQATGRRKPEAILKCRDASGHVESDGFVSFPHSLQAGRGVSHADITSAAGVNLPVVLFPNGKKRSAEALLEGKRPQLMLVVRAVHAHTGEPISDIRPAASVPFHLATRRTKGNEKAYIPSMDQGVRVLEHIGDACVKKLQELLCHVTPDLLPLPAAIPGGVVDTVAHMHALLGAVKHDHIAEANVFYKVLKLNGDKLKDVKAQIDRAVWPDAHLRVFYCGTYPAAPLPGLLDGVVDVGLVFTCTRGTVDLHEGGICGMVMRSPKHGVEVIVPRYQLLQDTSLKPLLFRHAKCAWEQEKHPGWGFYTYQGRHTFRMPPEGAGQYAVDATTPMCFTPGEYVPVSGGAGGAAAVTGALAELAGSAPVAAAAADAAPSVGAAGGWAGTAVETGLHEDAGAAHAAEACGAGRGGVATGVTEPDWERWQLPDSAAPSAAASPHTRGAASLGPRTPDLTPRSSGEPPPAPAPVAGPSSWMDTMAMAGVVAAPFSAAAGGAARQVAAAITSHLVRQRSGSLAAGHNPHAGKRVRLSLDGEDVAAPQFDLGAAAGEVASVSPFGVSDSQAALVPNEHVAFLSSCRLSGSLKCSVAVSGDLESFGPGGG